MNRRSFFRTLAVAVAGFTILPPATTYSRVWRATAKLDIESFQRRVWEIARQRGNPITIDAYTDAFGVEWIKRNMVEYYRERYRELLHLT